MQLPDVDFYKRWGGPLLLTAVAVGAWVGATDYRFNGPGSVSSIASTVTSTATVNNTVTAEADVPAPERRVETKVVRETVTLTKAPETRVVEAPAAPPITVVKTVEGRNPEPETQTVTETATVLQVNMHGKGRGPS